MTYEFIHIIRQAIQNQKVGLRQVLATVVALEGSSYRKPGVRMLMDQQGNRIGAVSGGCVEKEVYRRARSVFETGKAKVISYDGRYRLGCEGTLFILLEPFHLSAALIERFRTAVKKRESFIIESVFEGKEDREGPYGSTIRFMDNSSFTFASGKTLGSQLFSQELPPPK